MTREYHFYVYMLQSASRRAIYVGVTNNLRHREKKMWLIERMNPQWRDLAADWVPHLTPAAK